MQWDDTKNAGFTAGKPWLHVNPNYKEINVKSELANPNSIFYTYQKLIQLRKQNEIIVWGEYELLENTAEEVFAYIRKLGDEKWLVVANISDLENEFDMPAKAEEIVISNYDIDVPLKESVTLRAYEAFVVKH